MGRVEQGWFLVETSYFLLKIQILSCPGSSNQILQLPRTV